MILLKRLTFAQMARFLQDNLCEGPQHMPPDLATGFGDFQALLRELYADVAAFETGDTEKSYLALYHSVLFLYASFTVGAVREVDGRAELVVDKAALKTIYKGGSLSGAMTRLPRYGLQVTHRSSLAKAAEIILTTTRHPRLIPATAHFAALLRDAYARHTGECIANPLCSFFKSDYATASGERPIARPTFDPLRPDLLRTVGGYRDAWVAIVEALRGYGATQCSGLVHAHVSPCWSVSFCEQGKRPIAIFTVASETVFIEFTLPVKTAETIIRTRQQYAPAIRKRIEKLGCVNCPKACAGKHLTRVDGVTLCNGRAEARRIYALLTTPAEFASIQAMLAIRHAPAP